MTETIVLVVLLPIVAVSFALLGVGAYAWGRAMMTVANARAQFAQADAMIRDLAPASAPVEDDGFDEPRHYEAPARVDLENLEGLAEQAVRSRRADTVRTVDENAGIRDGEMGAVGGTTLYARG